MATNNETGVFKLPNGNYGYRVVINRKNLKVDTTYRQDENGNPFKTKAAARDARERKLYELKNAPPKSEYEYKRMTLAEVFEDYIQNGSSNKAHSTIRKQTSLWENHIKGRFGSRYVNEITANEIENYLSLLYHNGDEYSNTPYSYKYVEGFIKFFYLLFAYAYKDNAITTEKYSKMFLEKTTRIKMPPITQEDKINYDDLKIFNTYEIKQMDAIFKRGNCYLAFLLGYYCGLRLSEVFGLTCDDINFNDMTITIDKQLLYQDGVWCLCPVKTLNSIRVIDLPNNDTLLSLLINAVSKYTIRDKDGMIPAERDSYRNNETVIDKTTKDRKKLIGHNFINRKENGELLTPNSMKYWTLQIKDELGIDFQFHSLRKTHATMMANLNTPVIELMNRLGHKKYDTTMQFYIKTNALSREKLKQNIDCLEYGEAQKPLTEAERRLQEISNKLKN